MIFEANKVTPYVLSTHSAHKAPGTGVPSVTNEMPLSKKVDEVFIKSHNVLHSIVLL